MNFKVITTVLFLLGYQFLNAQIILINQAEQIAKNAFYERSYQQNPIEFQEISIADFRTEYLRQSPALYIFNFAGDGFAIISAEATLPPVLGYALIGHIPEKGFNENFDHFLNDYLDQVEFARNNENEQDIEISALWAKYSTQNINELSVKNEAIVVAPLVSSLWNQNSPYNMLCPENPLGPGGRVYAGCVATAMSMVMHYWRYPYQGTGTHGYYYDPYGFIYANFSQADYNFNHMKDVMDANMPEVALLQFHCGVAVEMMYGPNGSGAYSWDVPAAIKNHFGYHTTASFKEKSGYSNTGWANLLKEQLNLGQPMYYSGFSSTGGHAFVCDGYDDANLFHFNFGWGGSANGFFTLQNVGGYSSGQGAVINFIPGSNYPYNYSGLQIITGKSGSIEDGSGPVENYSSDAEINWLISPQTPEDSISSITLSFKRFDLAQDDYLFVYDGASESSNILGQFTGASLPSAINSSGNELLLVLKSNNPQTANGFLAEYTTQSPVWCSGMTLMNEAQGEISDGSLHFNYSNNVNCKWLINPAEIAPATLYFSAFDTEEIHDKVLIYDFSGMALLATYSGNYPPDNLPPPVTSPSGKFFIVFVSNGAITGKGWEAWYAPDFVGIEDVASENKLKLFPNPAGQIVNIRLPENISGDTRLSIYSLSGSLMLDQQFTVRDFDLSIDVSDFTPGVYVVTLHSSKGFYRNEMFVYR